MRSRGGGPPKSARPVKLNFDTHAPRSVFRSSNNSARADEPAYGPEWAATRSAVLRRDDYTCTNPRCRAIYRPPKHGKLDAHHIKPRRQGGPDTIDNLKTLCKPCHSLEHSHLERIGYGQSKRRRA